MLAEALGGVGQVALACMLLVPAAYGLSARPDGEPFTFEGNGAASGGVAVGADTILVCNDESNELHFYPVTGGKYTRVFNAADGVPVDADNPEMDLEAATKIGQVSYWLSSHGRNKNGKLRGSRYRIFSVVHGAELGQERLGGYRNDLMDLLVAQTGPAWDALELKKATQFSTFEDAELAPKRKGVNLEGLAATPNRGLLIGFRNPIPGRKAILVELQNPDGYLSGQPPTFGEPLLLDLGGLGVRAIEYCPGLQTYLVLAGPEHEKTNFALYAWNGQAGAAPTKLLDLTWNKFTPEGLIVFEGQQRVLILSDDDDSGRFKAAWVELTP